MYTKLVNWLSRPKIFTLFVIGTILIILVIPFAVSSASSWGPEEFLTDNSVYDGQPSLTLYQNTPYVVYKGEDGNDSEIFLKTKTLQGWQTKKLTNNDTADCFPDVAVDKKGNIHVVYLHGDPISAGGDYEVYHMVVKNNNIVLDERLTDNDLEEGAPAIAVYREEVHTTYSRHIIEGASEIHYANNAGGAWKHFLVTNHGYAEEGGSIGLHNGVASIAYTDQMESPSELDDEIYCNQKTAADWSISRVTVNSTRDGAPEIAVDKDGKAHIVFGHGDPLNAGGDTEIYYSNNTSGRWAETRLTDNDADEWDPTVAIYRRGIYVAYTLWNNSRKNNDIYFTQGQLGGIWSAPIALTGDDANDVLPSLAVASCGKAHLVYEKDVRGGEIVYRCQE